MSASLPTSAGDHRSPRPGGIVDGGLTPVQAEQLQRALSALRRLPELVGARWPGGAGNRDPPLPGLRTGEELLTPRPEQLVNQLIADGLPVETAEALVAKVRVFAWLDADGSAVLAVFEDRVAGQWDEVLHFARVFPFGGNDLARDIRGVLEVEHAQWIIARFEAPPGQGGEGSRVKRFGRGLVGVIRERMPRHSRLTAAEIESRYGIPLAHQRIFQRLADRYGYVIDVRPTNSDSVRFLQQGALPKPAFLKTKTIRSIDVWLGADPEYVGAVGFFDPVRPPLDEVPAELRDAVEERFEMRAAEYAQHRRLIAALGRRPIGPGRFERGGLRNTVLFGYDAAGRRVPVTADHDLLDLRHRDGRRLTPRELLEVVVALTEHNTGVQHPATMNWQPTEPADIALRDGIIAAHQPGREPLIRFTARRSARKAYAATQHPPS